MNGVNIVGFNFPASNGVFHVVNQVVTPPAGDVISVIASNPDLSIMASFIEETGLTNVLQTGNSFSHFLL